MPRFRKKPVEIEARLLTSDVLAASDLARWCGGEIANYRQIDGGDYFDGLDIKTLEGTMRADLGDWIIRGVKGEFYPCKPDIFQSTYERVPAPPVEQPEPEDEYTVTTADGTILAVGTYSEAMDAGIAHLESTAGRSFRVPVEPETDR